MGKEYIISSLSEMKEFGRNLAKTLSSPMTILLYGDLGAGKTEITRAMISELSGYDVTVPSPTFTLVQNYETKLGELNHFDLYRIKSADELEEIGLFDAIQNSITVIEWPDLAKPYVKPDKTIIINIRVKPDNTRIITIE